MKDVLRTTDPFAVVNHRWQGSMLSWHVVAAPFLVLLFGVVLRSHTVKKLESNAQPNRRTGWVALISFSTMALSGYLVQVAASAVWLDALVVTHIATFLVGYTAHLVIAWRLVWSADTGATREAELPDTARLSV